MHSDQTWTIDSIAHALPHPELRQTFMRETHLAPIGQLQTVLDRWIRFVQDFENGRPRVEALREHFNEHGQLPPENEAGAIELTVEDLRGRGAA